MLADLRISWTGAGSHQRFLAVASLALMGAGLVHAMVWLGQGMGSLDGPVSWRKPIEFGLSLGLTGVFMAWAMRWLPGHRRLGWIVAIAYGPAAWAEWALITLQKYRGVPSHFNTATGFDAAVFSAMGAMIVVLTGSVVVLLGWAMVGSRAPPSVAMGFRFGLGFLAVGLLLGYWIIRNGGQIVDEAVLASFDNAAVLGSAGDMKVPHAVALHGLQVVPALAWLVGFGSTDEGVRIRLVALCAASYAAMLAGTLVQMVAGRAPLDPSPIVLLLYVAGSAGVAAAYAVGLLSLRRAPVARRDRVG